MNGLSRFLVAVTPKAMLMGAMFMGAMVIGSVPTFGHTVFKKIMQKKYPEVRVSCEACHVKGKPKTERNEFGHLFFEKMKDKELTKNWEAFGDDRTGKRDFENKVMTPTFEKALELVKEMKKDDEIAYASLIAESKLDGLKPKKASSKSDEDDDEDDDGDDKNN